MALRLRIGELARRTGCKVETIRFYEREGLLRAPQRTSGNYRLYQESHIERVSFIRQCRSLDMALGDIRTLLEFRDSPERNCGDVNALLDQHIDHVARRLSELKAVQFQLRQLRRQCGDERAVRDCGILNELAHATAHPESGHGSSTRPTGRKREGQ